MLFPARPLRDPGQDQAPTKSLWGWHTGAPCLPWHLATQVSF